MKVLVCGGRDYSDKDYLTKVLDGNFAELGFTVLIHGDATGADSLAGEWARNNGIQEVKCPANWTYHGKKAGIVRNADMLKLNPDRVIAFPGGKGTANMIDQAFEASIPTFIYDVNSFKVLNEFCNS